MNLKISKKDKSNLVMEKVEEEVVEVKKIVKFAGNEGKEGKLQKGESRELDLIIML